jgi:hypothetical protein
MPKPKKKENEKDFIGRCIPHLFKKEKRYSYIKGTKE